MGKALELVTATAVAPGTTNFAAMAAAAGNTLTVRTSEQSAAVWLLMMWADFQGAAGVATVRLRSPKLHDNVQGIRFDLIVSDLNPFWPFGVRQRLYPQDVLTLEALGSTTAGDTETACLLVYYEDQPGVNARLFKWSDILPRIEEVFSVENTLSLGTGGGYSGEEAINAEFDQWKANEDYALLGYVVDAECAAVRVRGADSGNFGVGGPGNDLARHVTAEWFKRLAVAFDLPLIPVFNAANRGGILIDGVQDEVGTDTTVNTFWARLRK
jgi:hypothetical protein